MKTFLTILLFSCSSSLMLAQNIIIDNDKASITFDVGKEVSLGTVDGLRTTINLNLNDPSNSTIKASVDALSIKTGDNLRDEHITEGNDYFDGHKYADIFFESSRIIKTETGYVAYGALTIKDITLDVMMPFIKIDNKLVGRMKFHLGNFGIHTDKPENTSAINTVVRIEVPII